MRVAKIKVYKFKELTDEAQEKVLQHFRENFFDYKWYDCTFEDIKEIGKRFGIDISNIYFSGFWSQGDGACFEGHYSYNKGSVKAIKEYAPQDTELHRIASELQKLQRKHFYKLYANIKQSGHYYHKYCTNIDVGLDYYAYWQNSNVENDLKELLCDFMEWIYRQLKKEYEYITTDENIKELIDINEYEFTSDGEIWRGNE